MKPKHKHQVGDYIYVRQFETELRIDQKRIENGHLCYRLENGYVINETMI